MDNYKKYKFLNIFMLFWGVGFFIYSVYGMTHTNHVAVGLIYSFCAVAHVIMFGMNVNLFVERISTWNQIQHEKYSTPLIR